MGSPLAAGLGLLLLSLPLPAQSPLPELVASQGYADLVLFGGKVVSMDDPGTRPGSMGNVYSAMAVKGKRIMTLGGDGRIRELAGPGTVLVDLKGRTLIPGLINPHYHTYSGAGRVHAPELGLVDESVKVSVVAEETAEETARKIRETVINAIRTQEIAPGRWITLDLRESPSNRPATNRTWLYQGRINRRQLKGAAPEHPDVIEGIRKFGIIIDVTTSYLREIPHNLKDYGEQIRPFVMPVRTWIEQGIRVTSEPDGLNPWRPFYRLVTREVVDAETREKVLRQPEEAIDRVTALKMNTTWAAE